MHNAINHNCSLIRIAVILLLALFLNCAPSEPRVLLELAGLTEDVQTIEVSAQTLDPVNPITSRSVELDSSNIRILIVFPNALNGDLLITVKAKSAIQCSIAVGRATVTLSNGVPLYSETIPVNLITLPLALCPVFLNNTSAERILTMPAGIDCQEFQPCQAEFPLNTKMTIVSLSGKKIFCNNSSDCILNIDSAENILISTE